MVSAPLDHDDSDICLANIVIAQETLMLEDQGDATTGEGRNKRS